ncbi:MULTISPECIES: hypothetical protein [Halolamina]|uniref:Uncharacterized protein n=1 Tax=Halolamina pelagica TaxID=699431 RepID=A0A1I5NR82_9EURY|nr:MULTISPECIES: hypothetical protein [Halolamina]NHX36441.1 hypothetical protein [Halolamina sp. R1-12]SFP24325.1 hypothetical protein SAMN05216277_102157 [Halolamina pelagica]
MSLTDAFERSRILTVALLAAIAWLVFTAARVLGQFDFWSPEPVGMTPAAGVVGLLVMAVTILFAALVLSAFESDEPAPEAWPPEDVAE